MPRKIKNPVVVTLSKTMAGKLCDVMYEANDTRLGSMLANELEDQVGSVTLLLSRKDALAMHNAALHDAQRIMPTMSAKAYRVIEKKFREAYDARLRRSVGE